MKKSRIAIGICLIVTLVMVVGIPTFGSAKVIKLTVNDHNPPFAPPGKAIDAYVAAVNKAGAGKVELTVHHGGAVSPQPPILLSRNCRVF